MNKGIHLPGLFSYELCSYPPALFDANLLMRSGDKSEMAHVLLELLPQGADSLARQNIISSPHVNFVLDGGHILYLIPWPKLSSFGDLYQLYVSYVLRHYGAQATVVMDGYSAPSTKDECHIRRTKIMGCGVNVSHGMTLKMTKSAFLTNRQNKEQFVQQLGTEFVKAGIRVVQSTGDADVDIVKTVCERAHTTPVILIAEDTDLLVLLLHHMDQNHEKVWLQTRTKIVDLQLLATQLSAENRRSLPYIHAVSGCDTTSRPFMIGKSTALARQQFLHDDAAVFLDPNSCKERITEAGHHTLCVLYKVPDGLNLNLERAAKFSFKVTQRSEYLPPGKLNCQVCLIGTWHFCFITAYIMMFS